MALSTSCVRSLPPRSYGGRSGTRRRNFDERAATHAAKSRSPRITRGAGNVCPSTRPSRGRGQPARSSPGYERRAGRKPVERHHVRRGISAGQSSSDGVPDLVVATRGVQRLDAVEHGRGQFVAVEPGAGAHHVERGDTDNRSPVGDDDDPDHRTCRQGVPVPRQSPGRRAHAVGRSPRQARPNPERTHSRRSSSVTTSACTDVGPSRSPTPHHTFGGRVVVVTTRRLWRSCSQAGRVSWTRTRSTSSSPRHKGPQTPTGPGMTKREGRR